MTNQGNPATMPVTIASTPKMRIVHVYSATGCDVNIKQRHALLLLEQAEAATGIHVSTRITTATIADVFNGVMRLVSNVDVKASDLAVNRSSSGQIDACEDGGHAHGTSSDQFPSLLFGESVASVARHPTRGRTAIRRILSQLSSSRFCLDYYLHCCCVVSKNFFTVSEL